MHIFDKQDYYHAPSVLVSISGAPKEAYKEIAKGLTFREYLLKDAPLIHGIAEKEGNEEAMNVANTYYQMGQFYQGGEITYKIRSAKAEFLRDIKLHIPGSAVLVPFKSFLISFPFGRDDGILNIFVHADKLDEKEVDDIVSPDSKIVLDPDLRELMLAHKGHIKKQFRILCVISKSRKQEDFENFYYQFPIIEDMDMQEQIISMTKMGKGQKHFDKIDTSFNFVCNFCAYLGTRDPDVQKILGIKMVALKTTNPKKLRNAASRLVTGGYDYYDVGRIYDERRAYGKCEPGSDGKMIFKRFKVRAHIRMQWFGKRSETSPGEEQKPVLIEEYEKGDDLNEVLGARETVVGNMS